MGIQNEYIKASADIVVKYLLGVQETEPALINFINAVLEDSGFEPVTSVIIQNPFNIKNFKNDKQTILDIKAKDKKGNLYNIEVQSSGDKHFINRSLYYWSKLYSAEIKEAENYRELYPVICINLVDYIILPETNKFHNCFLLKEKDEGFILTNNQEIHFIELPKFKSYIASSQLEQWLVYLEYEGKADPGSKKLVDEVIKMNPEIESTHERYEKFSSSEEMRELYEARLRNQRDISTLVQSGFENGKISEKQETLIKQLSKKFGINDDNRQLIFEEKNPEILDNALDIIIFAINIDEVINVFNVYKE